MAESAGAWSSPELTSTGVPVNVADVAPAEEDEELHLRVVEDADSDEERDA